MNNVLFCLPLKPGMLADYEKFISIAQHEKKAEWADMLKRYDMHSVKIYHKNLAGVDYVFVYHDIGPKAPELLAKWNESDHPFDQWFGGQLVALLDGNAAEDPARSLFQMVA